MTVKELKILLDSQKDSQEVILKSSSGIEWKIQPANLILDRTNKKPIMYLEVE